MKAKITLSNKDEIAKKIKEAKTNANSKESKEEIAKEIKEASKEKDKEIREKADLAKDNLASSKIEEKEVDRELLENINESQNKLSLEEELNQKKEDLPNLDSLAYKNYPNTAASLEEQKPENLISVLDEVPYLKGEIDEKPFEYIAEMKEPNEGLYSNLTGTIQEQMTNEMGPISLYQKKDEDEGNKLYFTS